MDFKKITVYSHRKKRCNMKFEKREQKTLQRRIERFIELGKEKHGNDRYDYSMAREEYTNNRIPVHLRCNQCNGEPFLVYPFMHTNKGDNQKGTCQDCYVPQVTVQETRWDPNLPERIKDFRDKMSKRHKGRYSYPHLEKEYKNELSEITVVCNKCNGEPYTRLARSLKMKDRYAGCEACNKEKMVETIRKKNRARQLRNYQVKDEPVEYGCIYKITNTKNGKFYIGYTTMTAKKRLQSHIDETRRMQKQYKGKKSYLHNAMDYHGIEHFKVEILEECSNVSPIFLGKLEMEYIAKEKPHYNLSAGGELSA